MTRQRIGVAMAMVAVLGASFAGLAEDGKLPAGQLLAKFSDHVKLAISVSAVAVFSPSLVDARLQIERLLVLLRGDGRDRSLGLVQEAVALPDWIAAGGFDAEREKALFGAAENVRAFLRLAVDAAASAERARTLESAGIDLFRVYAYLVAAWGLPVDGIAVPGLFALLRAFEIPLSV